MRADQWPSPDSPSCRAMDSSIGCALHFFRLHDWVFPMVTVPPSSAAVLKFGAANEFVLFIIFWEVLDLFLICLLFLPLCIIRHREAPMINQTLVVRRVGQT